MVGPVVVAAEAAASAAILATAKAGVPVAEACAAFGAPVPEVRSLTQRRGPQVIAPSRAGAAQEATTEPVPGGAPLTPTGRVTPLPPTSASLVEATVVATVGAAALGAVPVAVAKTVVLVMAATFLFPSPLGAAGAPPPKVETALAPSREPSIDKATTVGSGVAEPK